MGQATQVAAYLDKEKPWVSRMEYNALGQETQRLFSNNICSAWDYDKAGRPIFHEVSNQRSKADAAHQGIFGNVVGWSDTLRRHRYEWDVNYQLKEVTNGLTKGTTVYSYDQFSNLVSAKESGFETIFRSTDIVGNLYETKDCSDRIYGAGSRLEKSCINLKEKRNKYQGGYGKLITKGRQFFYDEEGKKVWERNLDIYGRVKTEEALGEKNFIPFRFQGQYEDEETELYYNRFRYYDSQQGQYTQQDPIGLAGGNPTLYGYVYDTLCELDPFGLGRMPSWMTTSTALNK